MAMSSRANVLDYVMFISPTRRCDVHQIIDVNRKLVLVHSYKLEILASVVGRSFNFMLMGKKTAKSFTVVML